MLNLGYALFDFFILFWTSAQGRVFTMYFFPLIWLAKGLGDSEQLLKGKTFPPDKGEHSVLRELYISP